MLIVDCDNNPKAAEFVRLTELCEKRPGQFRAVMMAAKAKVQLWKQLGLKTSLNEEYEIRNGVLIISEYEKV